MIYQLLTTDKFDRSFKKLDTQTQRIIKAWIVKNLMNYTNPRLHGKEFTANRSNGWRYKVGDYRILADIRDFELILILINIGHRRDIYNKQSD